MHMEMYFILLDVTYQGGFGHCFQSYVICFLVFTGRMWLDFSVFCCVALVEVILCPRAHYSSQPDRNSDSKITRNRMNNRLKKMDRRMD